jgi:hypothetical protein
MANRLDLQDKLESILGSSNVYFQPPTSLKMSYPAIVYELSNIDNDFANDEVYNQRREYKLTVIDKNPDSEYIEVIARLPKCRFDRHYKSNNLNHYVFTLYY